MSDDVRQKILARRARFVTAAIASAGLAACRPCLDVAPPDDGPRDAGAADAADASKSVPSVSAEPFDASGPQAAACLTPMVFDAGAPSDVGGAGSGAAGDAATPDAAPKEVGPKPHPCLKVAPGKDFDL